MNSLVNLIVRTIIRGAVYKWVFRLPKTVLIGVFAIACVAFLAVNR